MLSLSSSNTASCLLFFLLSSCLFSSSLLYLLRMLLISSKSSGFSSLTLCKYCSNLRSDYFLSSILLCLLFSIFNILSFLIMSCSFSIRSYSSVFFFSSALCFFLSFSCRKTENWIIDSWISRSFYLNSFSCSRNSSSACLLSFFLDS